MKKTRSELIDIFRGLSVLGMIIFHVLFLFDYQGIVKINVFSGLIGIVGEIVRHSFLFLVGFSLVLSRVRSSSYGIFLKKQLKRIAKILLVAYSVTLGTWFMVGDEFVIFGVLHCIAFSSLLFTLFRPTLLSAVLVAVFVSILDPMRSLFAFDTPLAYIFGFAVYHEPPAIDYFPLVPWIRVIALGVIIGVFVERDFKNLLLYKIHLPIHIKNLLLTLGENALFAYALHIPLMVAFLQVIMFI